MLLQWPVTENKGLPNWHSNLVTGHVASLGHIRVHCCIQALEATAGLRGLYLPTNDPYAMLQCAVVPVLCNGLAHFLLQNCPIHWRIPIWTPQLMLSQRQSAPNGISIICFSAQHTLDPNTHTDWQTHRVRTVCVSVSRAVYIRHL